MSAAADERGDGDPARPTNERLLVIAFASFATLGIAQTTAAVLAGSQSLLADAVAMLVDSLTYLFNWCAERQKATYVAVLLPPQEGDGDGEARARLLLRKRTLQLDIVTPLVSVTTLLVVTALTLRDSVGVLVDAQRDSSDHAEPNVNVMIAFCVLNVFLDSLNMCCFARAQHAFGYSTAVDRVAAPAMADDGHGEGGRSEEGTSMTPFLERPPSGGGESPANLNMCSAYTHVFADSLRTVAMILASVLAKTVPAIDPAVADASAAIAVSVVIIFSLAPLIGGVVKSVSWLRRVNTLIEAQAQREAPELDGRNELL